MRRTVLVVEDDPSVRSYLEILLSLEEVEVHAAADGEAAIQAAERLSPEVVLLDVGLPGRSGLDVCRTLKQKAPGTRVVMLSGRAGDDDELAGLAAGADAYLAKPFSPIELFRQMRVRAR